MKYKSFEDFLEKNGSSWDEFLQAIEYNSDDYGRIDFEKTGDTPKIIFYEKRPHSGLRLSGLISNSIIWARTLQGQNYWEKLHYRFMAFIDRTNIVRLPLKMPPVNRQILEEMHEIELDQPKTQTTFKEDMI